MSNIEYELKNYFVKAGNVRDEYIKGDREIRDDENLSLQGKVQKLDEHYQAYKVKHEEVIKSYKTWRENARERLVKKIYSHPVLSVTGAERLRPLIEKSEEAYKTGYKEFKTLAERAINMRDKEQIRAVAATAYSKADWETLRKLNSYDGAIEDILIYERLFGALSDATTKMKINIELRGLTKPKRS